MDPQRAFRALECSRRSLRADVDTSLRAGRSGAFRLLHPALCGSGVVDESHGLPPSGRILGASNNRLETITLAAVTMRKPRVPLGLLAWRLNQLHITTDGASNAAAVKNPQRQRGRLTLRVGIAESHRLKK